VPGPATAGGRAAVDVALVLPDHRYQHKYGKLESDQFLSSLLGATLSASFRDARREQ